MYRTDSMAHATVYEIRDGNRITCHGTLDDISASVGHGAKCTSVVSLRDRSSAHFKVIPHGSKAALLYVPRGGDQ